MAAVGRVRRCPAVELLGQQFVASPQLEDAEGLLVRFRDDAFCTRPDSGCKSLRLTGELPGRWNAKGLVRGRRSARNQPEG